MFIIRVKDYTWVNLFDFLPSKCSKKTDILFPFTPLEKLTDDLERRMEKRVSDVNSFDNSITNIKEMITYFK